MSISLLSNTSKRFNIAGRMAGVSVLLSGLLLALPVNAQDVEESFKLCGTCHTIGGGKLIGPDLANIDQRRSEEWLIKFIRSAQSMINNGDEVALALKQEYNNIIMPDNTNMSDDQIRSLIAYIVSKSPGRDEPQESAPIAEGSAGSGDSAVVEDTSAVSDNSAPDDPTIAGRPLSEATKDDLLSGERLFAGYAQFANAGPSCISCHNIKSDSIISGGALAKDLTDAYTRLSGAGVGAILSGLSFPAMQQAYGDTPLTDEEVYDLVAFLKQSAELENSQAGTDYGLQLFLVGCVGTVLLLLLFSGLWFKRKKRSVNHLMFERQVKSM